MRALSDPPGLPPVFWARIIAADHRLLMLDYDGTLAPFDVRRDQARLSEGMARHIERIASDRSATVAIVSGRAMAELDRLAGPLPVVLAAEHGWDLRLHDGSLLRHPLSRAAEGDLEAAVAIATRAGWGDRLERKRCSVVMHTRGLPLDVAEAMARACWSLWRDLACGALRLDHIDGGVEIRARSRDKETVVRELRSGLPAGTLPVFLGDDETDEDAFRAVADDGFGIRVGPESRPTLASGRLRSIDDVEAFLGRWVQVTRPARESGAGAS